MKIDFATLAFGYKVKVGNATPNWATALGQGKGYKINQDEEIDELLKGIIYSSVPLSKISAKFGKGASFVTGDSEDSPIIQAACFSKIYVNDVCIEKQKFILLITRDTSESHKGRLRLKYGPSNTYHHDSINTYSNKDFYAQVREQLGLSDDACWFVSNINIKEQDELYLKAYIVNSKGLEEYSDSKSLHQAWRKIAYEYFSSDKNDNLDVGFNKIYYGIPGCGKSFMVDKYIRERYPIKEQYEENVFRTTFYLDYSNADFIGQIIPKVIENNVTYEPNFGPFTKALKRAYETENMVYLVIEEINRGNSSAIFGDLFQLLDRLDENKARERNDGSKVGDSEYPITNTFLEDCIGIKKGKVVIPSNLTILATMNTSDQNVFPLDTAFKRRWKMEKVVDDYKRSNYHNFYIPQEKREFITWEEFLEVINKFIISSDEGYNLEDKQIGSYFITNDILVNPESEIYDIEYNNRVEQFNNKVLEYLWSDVAKFDRTRWINHEKINRDKTPNSFDELVKLVNEYGFKNTLEAFNDNEGE